MKLTIVSIAACMFVMALSSCNGLWLDTYWRSERYILIAVDAKSQMSFAYDLGGGMAQGLVGPTVFAIGADEKHIILKEHPSTDGINFDRLQTNYYVVDRTTSSSFADRKKGVRGPYSQEEFLKLKVAEDLPEFNKSFAELE